MNNLKFLINGFKCFEQNETLDFNQLTLLTGANSAGKSSVIQALLLTEKVAFSKSNIISFSDEKFALDIGSYDDIANENSTGDLLFELDGCRWEIKADDVDSHENGKNVAFRSDCMEDMKGLFSSGFSFIAADRMAPHYEYKYSNNEVDLCDCHGNNLGDVLNKHDRDNVDSNRSLLGTSNKLKILLDEWVDYIFPNVSLLIKNTGSDSYKVMEHDRFAATNIGFGITYALPILINGLLIKSGGWLVVENPEAHLHPKAQSNMGYYLACVASAGVRVIVETHSEHVVNGIRRFVLKKDSLLKTDDVTIYFFKKMGSEKKIEKLDIDESGNVSDLPVDFFDQVRQDMQQIIQLGIQRAKE